MKAVSGRVLLVAVCKWRLTAYSFEKLAYASSFSRVSFWMHALPCHACRGDFGAGISFASFPRFWAVAEAAHAVLQASEFGVHTRNVEIDGIAVMNRVRSERDRFVGFVVESVEEIPEVQADGADHGSYYARVSRALWPMCCIDRLKSQRKQSFSSGFSKLVV